MKCIPTLKIILTFNSTLTKLNLKLNLNSISTLTQLNLNSTSTLPQLKLNLNYTYSTIKPFLSTYTLTFKAVGQNNLNVESRMIHNKFYSCPTEWVRGGVCSCVGAHCPSYATLLFFQSDSLKKGIIENWLKSNKVWDCCFH